MTRDSDDSPMDGSQAARETPPGGFFRTEGGHFRWDPPPVEQLALLLPGYEFLSQVGRGGMGVVYLARQLALEREVAVKVMPPVAVTDDPTFVDRFRNEAKALARLNHPGIIQVYDFGETSDGQLYFIMEFVEGLDLHQILAASPGFRLPPPEVVSILCQACEALAFAHDRGIVHRDIKPPNLLVTPDKKVKIADFGLAQRALDDLADSPGEVAVIGTVGYSAPEIFEGRTDVDARADLYALGMTAFEMVTGQLPRHSGQVPTEVLGELDPRWDAIFSKATSADRASRFQSAPEFSVALAELLSPRPNALRDPVSPGVRVRKVLVPALVAAAFFLVAAYFGNQAFRSDRPTADLAPGRDDLSESESPPLPSLPPAVSGDLEPNQNPPPDPTVALAKSAASPESVAPPPPPVAAAPAMPPAPTPPVAVSPTALASVAVPAPLPPVSPPPATPPPPRPAPAELTALKRSFAANVASLASVPAREATDRLRVGYRSSLQRALDEQRRVSATSPAATAFENELTVFAAGAALPPDTAATPPALLRGRGIYREHLAKIEEDRIGNLLALLTPHIGELIQLEQRFTKEGRGEDAALVRSHRESLAADPLAEP